MAKSIEEARQERAQRLTLGLRDRLLLRHGAAGNRRATGSAPFAHGVRDNYAASTQIQRNCLGGAETSIAPLYLRDFCAPHGATTRSTS